MDTELSDQLKKKRILVIDDQGSMRSVLQSFLKEVGFRKVACTIDGLDGIRFLESNAVDLVICDWAMPKMSGLEVLRTIRQCGDTRNLPFMMVTSSSELTRVRDAVEAGVSDYLIKPFRPLQLCQKVLHLLGESSYQARRLRPRKVELNDDPNETDASEVVDLSKLDEQSH